MWKRFFAQAYCVICFIALLAMVILSCTGCASRPVVATSPLKCSSEIPKELLQACAVPPRITAGATFEAVLQDNAKTTEELHKCALKVEALKQAIDKCSSAEK